MKTIKPEITSRIAKLEDIKRLAKLADENSSKTIPLELSGSDETGFEEREDFSILKDLQNPEVSYKLYYGIRSLLISNLPPQQQYKKLRDYIYELKNVFLNRGKRKDATGRRKSDGRQAYISADLTVLFELVANWVKTGANSMELIYALERLNEERGYEYNDEEKPVKKAK